jgi:hypothetical protein
VSCPQHPSPRSRFPFALLLAALIVRHTAPAQAAVIRVPADQPDVRAAAAAAASGDTVLLWPGLHTGGVFVNNKRLTFASRYLVTGDTALVSQTVLTGDLNGQCNGQPGCAGNSVLEFGNNAAGSAVIGLTLTRGENGVGSASAVDLIHCRLIANNDGVDFTTGSGGTFRSNLFTGNTDDGIDLNGHMNLTIIDNDIRNNADDGIEYRLYSYSGPSVEVDITGNRITGNGEDGIQFIDYTSSGAYVLRVERNLFQTNYDAAGLSAAISFMPGSETIETLAGAPSARRTYVINNTFVGERNGMVGGANAVVLNNIFTGISGVALSRVSGSSIASYNLFWGCGTNYSQSAIDVPHLLFGNPQLTGTAHLTNASPAINAGTAFFQWQGVTVLNLPPASYADGAPDLGAYESAPNTAPVVSAGPDRTVSLSSDVEDAGTPGAPPLRADAPLAGSFSDDGLPYPPTPAITWTQVSGPGPVLFQNPALPIARATFSVPGAYVLQLTVNDGKLAASDQVTVTVLAPYNLPPFVDAGRNLTVTLPSQGQLTGTVLDDGLPMPPGAVSVQWTKRSGPGTVSFSSSTSLSLRAGFSLPGTYVLGLAASDGALSASDTVTITVLPVPNRAPTVDAGANQTVTLPSDAALDATVIDDGLPNPPATVTTSWTAVSGPGAVTFLNSSAVDTRASFAVSGTYVLRLTASDGALGASDTVTITVLPVPNQPPVVDAGPDQSFMFPLGADLDGTVTDDGKPNPPGALTTTWSMVSGPGAVTFQSPGAIDTHAGFGAPGTYVLRLAASDGALTASDLVQIVVQPPPPAWEGRIATGNDDAQESDNGHVSRADSQLDLGANFGNQTTGLRFPNVPVPRGAIVIAAWVQFATETPSSDSTSLTVQAQAADSATAFLTTKWNLSLRPRTAAAATWAPPPWNAAGDAGAPQRTSNLSSVIQEIVGRPGWTSGNAIAILVTGSGHRMARAYESGAASAALLHIEYGGIVAPLALREPSRPVALAPAPRIPPAGASALVEFALRGVRPQPSRGPMTISFSLADDGPASLELHDVAGRRLMTREVGAMGPGAHTVELSETLPAGIYLVRLTQGSRALTRKAIVLP